MKKIFMLVTAFGMIAVTAQGQACDTLRGNLTSMTLTPDKSYVLEGIVVVPDTEVLTIRPGVTICAMPDAGLVVDRGAQLQAIGKADSLITFTSVKALGSRVPGDWRGIAIMGKANNNYVNGGDNLLPITRGVTTYYGGEVIANGGAVDSDNSGTLAYMSIEYAGQNYTGDNYKGALLLNCVGDATDIHHVQILNPLNAGLTILGGKVDAHDLYIQNVEREDVYIDFGYRGTLTDVLAIKNTNMVGITYATDAKGIYVSNNPGSPTNTPLTNPIIDAFTLIGPQQCGTITGDLSKGIYFDNNGGGTFSNVVVSGFEMGVQIEDDATATRATSSLMFSYVTVSQPSLQIAFFGGSLWPCGAGIVDWLTGGTGCNFVTDNQIGITPLDYDANICTDYCTTAPDFKIGNLSELITRENGLQKVGVLQTTPVFTWVKTCPEATCCEEESQARILPLEAYPNPVLHTVMVNMPIVKDSKVKVQVIQLSTGKIFFQEVTASKAALQLDMSTYPKGNYQVQIVTEQAIYQATVNKD